MGSKESDTTDQGGTAQQLWVQLAPKEAFPPERGSAPVWAPAYFPSFFPINPAATLLLHAPALLHCLHLHV